MVGGGVFKVYSHFRKEGAQQGGQDKEQTKKNSWRRQPVADPFDKVHEGGKGTFLLGYFLYFHHNQLLP